MITNVLLENKALVPVAVLVVAVVCVVVGHLAARSARALWTLVVLSLFPVVALTLVPTSGRAYEVCAVQFALPTLGSVELLANVALFVPLAHFATLATHRPLTTLAAAALLSATVEATQALLPSIGRACDTTDWTMNTAGAALGVLLATATTTLTHRRTPRA